MIKLSVLLMLFALLVLTECHDGNKQSKLSENMIKHLITKGYVLSDFQNEPKEKWDSALGLKGNEKIESMIFMKDEKMYKAYLFQYKNYKILMSDTEAGKFTKGNPPLPYPEYFALSRNVGIYSNYYMIVYAKKENEKELNIIFKTIKDWDNIMRRI